MNTPNQITIRIETHYGRQTVYPVCKIALLFAQIAQTKTLTARSIRLIKDLGYEVQVQAPTLNERLNHEGN